MYYENIGFKIVITYLPNAYVLAKKHIHVSSHTYETYLVEINFYYCYFFLTYICEEMVLALAMLLISNLI